MADVSFAAPFVRPQRRFACGHDRRHVRRTGHFFGPLALPLGRGHQKSKVCLFDAALNMLLNYDPVHLLTGDTPTRVGNGTPVARSSRVYRVQSGDLMITVGLNRLFRSLCAVLQRPDLAEHPDYASNPLRIQNEVYLNALLNAAFATQSRDDWLEKLYEAGVPCAPLLGQYTVEVLRDISGFTTMPSPPWLPMARWWVTHLETVEGHPSPYPRVQTLAQAGVLHMSFPKRANGVAHRLKRLTGLGVLLGIDEPPQLQKAQPSRYEFKALVGFRGRGVVNVVHSDFCPLLVRESFVFQKPSSQLRAFG